MKIYLLKLLCVIRLKADDELLAGFDLMVEVVRLTEPVFYIGYKDHRKIINT